MPRGRRSAKSLARAPCRGPPLRLHGFAKGDQGPLDREIEAATAAWEKRDLERALQARGVAAGAVLSAPEYLSDPHLRERGYFAEQEHAEAGLCVWDGSPLNFNGDRGYGDFTSAPLLGGPNRALLRDLLGLSDAQIDALYAEGVLAEAPPARAQ
jgi:crotonobetainyl-CoA:carnitine CoA-transferase CaiB-like acyl-CoA transferase